MQRYIFKRIVQAIFCVVGVTIIVFSLTRLSGDPLSLLLAPDAMQEDVEEMISILGLDEPFHVQYWDFISRAVQGDFGKSLRWKRPCIDIFLEKFPNTLQLAVLSMAWALLVGISVGILSAVKVGTWFDNFGKIFALLGQATPVFWLGIMLMMVFAVNFRWLPTSGMGGIENLILPSVTLGWIFTASITRLTRSAMLDVLDSEYIKMARIKGVPERFVIIKHAFKNAMIPVVTVASLQFITLLNGTVITETVFNWPGVGRLVVDSIFARDYPMVQTVVLIASCLFVFTNLAVDILYAYIDPRIRYK